MSLFSKIQLGSKAVRPVGTTLETGDVSSDASPKKDIAIKIGIFLTLIVASMFTFRRGSEFQYAIVADEIWRWEDLVSPFDYPILKTDEESAADILEIRTSTLPIFIVAEDVTKSFQENVDSLSLELTNVLALYASFRNHQSRGRLDFAIQDSLSFLQAKAAITLQLSNAQWGDLQESYANSVPGSSSTSRDRATLSLDQEIVSLVWNTGTPLLRRGVINIPRDSVFSSRVTVRNEASPFQKPHNSCRFADNGRSIQLGPNSIPESIPEQPIECRAGHGSFLSDVLGLSPIRSCGHRSALGGPGKGAVANGECCP